MTFVNNVSKITSEMENQLSADSLVQRLAQLHNYSLKLIQYSSLDHLLEQIATLACQHTGAKGASVNLHEGGRLPMRAASVRLENNKPLVVENPAYAQTIFRAMSQGSGPARFPPDYRAKLVSLTNQHPEVQSFLYVPILQGGKLIGQILTVNKHEERAFSSEDQKVIEMLAAYAEIGISNSILRASLTQRSNSLNRRIENLALLNKLASTLSSDIETNEMMRETLTQVIDSLQLAAGELYLCQEDCSVHQLELHYGDSVDIFWKQTQFERGAGVVGKTASSGRSVILDLYEDEIEDLNENVYHSRIQQIACFPLSGLSGALGVLCIATFQPQTLDELQLQFLAIISSWVGTVIENARLNLQQRRLAVLEERERIGMELHDGTIQSIYAVGLTLEKAKLLMENGNQAALERIENSMKSLNNIIRELRSYILDMRPFYLDGETLFIGIQRLVNEFHGNTQVEVDLQGSTDDFRYLPDTQALALFHICQEALANIAKHAKATRVSISLWTVPGRALLEVADNGSGFNPSETRLSLGHGLSNMQIRARNAGGEVDISSEPGSGTTVLTWVPFTSNAPLPPAEQRTTAADRP